MACLVSPSKITTQLCEPHRLQSAVPVLCCSFGHAIFSLRIKSPQGTFNRAQCHCRLTWISKHIISLHITAELYTWMFLSTLKRSLSELHVKTSIEISMLFPDIWVVAAVILEGHPILKTLSRLRIIMEANIWAKGLWMYMHKDLCSKSVISINYVLKQGCPRLCLRFLKSGISR